MSDHEETSSIESVPGFTLNELKSSANKQLVTGQADKTNENSEHSNRELIENREKVGKEKSENSNPKTPEKEGIDSTDELCSYSLEKKSLQSNTGKVDFNQLCLDNKEREKEHFESIQPENVSIEIKSTELENSKEKTEEQLENIKKCYQDSLAKIIELEGRFSENNAINVGLNQEVLRLSKHLQIEKENNELILNEKNVFSKKIEETKEKIQNDNMNHIKMYRIYERKIEEMKAENKQVKAETVNLNRMLQNKEENINQEINQFKIQLTECQEEKKKMSQELIEKSKTLENSQLEIQRLSNESENNTKLNNPEEKISREYHEKLLEISEMKNIDKDLSGNLECINNEMKDQIEEYISNICSEFNENNLLTPISIDLSNKIKNLELSISNTLDKFYTNLKIGFENSENDFQINFSKILIIKKNLELLIKIDSIEVGSSNIDEIDSSSNIDEIDSNLAEIQNFIDSIEILSQNLRVEIIETRSDLKLSQSKCIAVINEIDKKNLDKLSNCVKENRILLKNLFNEKNLLKKKLVELKKSFIEKEKPEPRILK